MKKPVKIPGGEVYGAVGVPDPAAAMARIWAAPRMRDRMRFALCLVMEGVSYRRAAAAAGLRSHRDVYRSACVAGLTQLHTIRRRERATYQNEGEHLHKILARAIR